MAMKNTVNGGSCGCRYPYRVDRDKWYRHGSEFPGSRRLCDHLVSTCQSYIMRVSRVGEGRLVGRPLMHYISGISLVRYNNNYSLSEVRVSTLNVPCSSLRSSSVFGLR